MASIFSGAIVQMLLARYAAEIQLHVRHRRARLVMISESRKTAIISRKNKAQIFWAGAKRQVAFGYGNTRQSACQHWSHPSVVHHHCEQSHPTSVLNYSSKQSNLHKCFTGAKRMHTPKNENFKYVLRICWKCCWLPRTLLIVCIEWAEETNGFFFYNIQMNYSIVDEQAVSVLTIEP